MSKQATKTNDDAANVETDDEYNISKHILKYRAMYVPTMGVDNRGSLDNDDAIAKTLRSLDPDRVVRIAEEALGFKKGELAAKYANLNRGMRRMNSGNRIRSALKRGDLTKTALKAALKAA